MMYCPRHPDEPCQCEWVPITPQPAKLTFGRLMIRISLVMIFLSPISMLDGVPFVSALGMFIAGWLSLGVTMLVLWWWARRHESPAARAIRIASKSPAIEIPTAEGRTVSVESRDVAAAAFRRSKGWE